MNKRITFLLFWLPVCLLGQSDSLRLDSADALFRSGQLDSAFYMYSTLTKSDELAYKIEGYSGCLRYLIDKNDFDRADSIIDIVDNNYIPDNPIPELVEYYIRKAKVQERKSGFESAYLYGRKAISLSRQLPEAKKELGYAFQYISNLHSEAEKPDSALTYMERAYEILRVELDTSKLYFANIYNSLAVVYFHVSDFHQSRKYYNHAIALSEQYPGQGTDVLAMAYSNLAQIDIIQNNYAVAKELLDKSINYNKLGGYLLSASYDYRSLGIIHYYEGYYSLALEYLNKCYEIRSRLLEPGHPLISNTEQVLAILYEVSGRYEESIELQKKVLRNYQKSFGLHSYSVAASHENLAIGYQKINILDSALYHISEANQYFRTVLTEPVDEVAVHYQSYAGILNADGQYEEALDKAIVAKNLITTLEFEETTTMAVVLSLLGVISNNLGDESASDHYFNQAMTLIANDGEYLQIPDVADILFDYTLVLGDRILQQRTSSTEENYFEYLNDYIQQTENIRKQNSDPYSKSIHAFNSTEQYKRVLNINADLYKKYDDEKYARLCFRMSELMKTALMRDMLDSRIASYKDVPDSILTVEDSMNRQVTSLYLALEQQRTSDSLRQVLIATQEQFTAFYQEVQEQYPHYYQLKFETRIPEPEEIQSKIDDQTTYIAYAEDEQNLYAFVMDKERFFMVELPGRTSIDSLVTLWLKEIQRLNRQNEIFLGQQLYKRLWEPISEHIKYDKVVITPIGSLSYINFELLVNEEANYLIHDFTISYFLSFASQFHQHRPNVTRDRPVLTNIAPGFSDELKKEYLDGLEVDELPDSTYLRFVRQPWAVRLAQSLGRKLRSHNLIGSSATESATREALTSSSIVQFSTHARMEWDDPLRSHLVLTKDHSEDDGYLHAYEIFGLDIPVELAILGSCQSGVGKDRSGDAMISLGYGMQFAGCQNTITSLWSVDEKSNQTIMASFFERMSKSNKLSESLREAKLEFIESANLFERHPYYWGGMILSGADDDVRISGRRPFSLYLFIGVVVLIILWGFLNHHGNKNIPLPFLGVKTRNPRY